MNLQERADLCIAQGALTNSKRPSTFVEGIYPTHLSRGQGCYVWDVKGKKYFDFICGLGCNILGYANEDINRAIGEQLQKGATLSLSTELEVVLAEKIKTIFPFVDCMKFLKTGSDACSAAVRIARTYHGIESENENLLEMWLKETFERVSQGQRQDEWLSRTMQKLYPSISSDTSYKGNKKTSSEEICEFRERPNNGEKTQPKEISKKQKSNAPQSSLSSETCSLLRGTHQEVVRAMWKSQLASPSLRLQSSTRGSLVVPDVSLKGARWLILSDAYHGHHDIFVSLTYPAIGIPPHFGILPLKDNEDLIPIAAAIIIEPIMTDFSKERIQWLKDLRKKCTETGTLLIFDEVITGFRYPRFSVSNYYGIEPDLICLGKAMANGMPLSVVAGKKEIMNCGEYFVSSTFAGETLSLAAASKTIDLLLGYYKIETLWQKGGEWLEEFNSLWPTMIKIEGYPTRGRFVGDEMVRALFFQESIESGMLFGPSWFYNFPMSLKNDITLPACKDIVCKIKSGNVKLKGKLPQSPFAEKMRKNL